MLLLTDELKVGESLILRVEDSELIYSEDLQEQIEDGEHSDDSDSDEDETDESSDPMTVVVATEQNDVALSDTNYVSLQNVRVRQKRALPSSEATPAAKKQQKEKWCLC